MAKILFISEKIHPHSWGLSQSLMTDQNELIFLTSKGQVPIEPLREGFQVLNFFSKWSIFEALQFFPLFWQNRFDAIYFYLDGDELNSAQTFIFRMSLLFPQVAILTTTMNIKRGLQEKTNFRRLIQFSDLVTTPTFSMLSQLRGLNTKNKKQVRGLLPPLGHIHKLNTTGTNEKIAKIQEVAQKRKIFAIPFWPENFDVSDLDPLTEVKEAYFVFAGSFDGQTTSQRKKIQADIEEKLGPHWIVTGELDLCERHDLIQASAFLFLAGLNLDPVTLGDYFQLALLASTPVIIDDGQKELYPPIWTHGENALIFPRNRFQIRASAVASQMSDFLMSPRYFQDKNRALIQSLVDSPTNEIRRLFNKALSVKSSS